MPCQKFPIPGGAAIICSRGGRRARCSVPGCTRAHTRLCDFALASAPGATCDARLCDQHAHRRDSDRDYCPPHHRLAGGAP